MKLLLDIGQREAEPLRDAHEGDTPERGTLETPLPTGTAGGFDRTALLVEPDRRHRHAGALGKLFASIRHR